MKHLTLLQIIKEELSNFSDWQSNEPSIADRYYEKLTGAAAQQQKQQPVEKTDAELIGYVTITWGTPIKTPIPVYKNPKSLNDFEKFVRGFLLSNGDFYLAKKGDALHFDILDMLDKKGILPHGSTQDYATTYPAEFIAVQRIFNTNSFSQSSEYDEFPDNYAQYFKIANTKFPYKFQNITINEEQLDPNLQISYLPQGYQHNILDELK